MRPHGPGIVKTSRARRSENCLEVVDRHSEVVIDRGNGGRAFEEMELQIAQTEPLDGEPEVGRVDRLGAEDLGVEPDRILEVLGPDADVVDMRSRHELTIQRRHSLACGR